MLQTLALAVSTLALTFSLGCGTSDTNDTGDGDYYAGDNGTGSDSGSGSDGTGTGSGDDGATGGTVMPQADEPLPAPLRAITVDSVQALRDAVATAQPGDEITVSDKVYNVASYVDVTHSGTADHPIVITAATIGGARIEGTAGFRPTGVHDVVIRGFDFRFSAGSRAITCNDCSNVRFTRNHFELTPVDYSHWLILGGTSNHNRIDRNVFINKSTNGNFITIDGTSTEVAKYNVIELNYFANQTWGGSNEGECIRIGYSGLKYSKGYNVVQNNLFEHCDGDPEVVSVKSSNNTIRFNTFRNNAGALVFRHGHGSQAIGNFFLHNNGGVRFYGDDHKFVNNYFEGNYGTGVRSTIVIGSGTQLDDDPTSPIGYDAPERVLVAFNTLVNNTTDVQIGNVSTDSVGPIDTTFADNLIVGNSGSAVRTVKAGTTFTWAGNLLSGAATTGDLPTSGYTRASDAKLVSSGGFMHLTSDSPARDAAVGSYTNVTDDIDGAPRAGTFDIGADEYTTDASTRRPLVVSDVGPAAP